VSFLLITIVISINNIDKKTIGTVKDIANPSIEYTLRSNKRNPKIKINLKTYPNKAAK
jgi:hypothetical protein